VVIVVGPLAIGLKSEPRIEPNSGGVRGTHFKQDALKATLFEF
jgi:hypothetical protein